MILNAILNTKSLKRLSPYIFVAVSFALIIFAPFRPEPKIFWDEDYHVVFAQKYLNKVFNMEIHPPLGKLLVALGEQLLDYNSDDSQFINLELTRETPPGFSLVGYRFFPRILTVFSAPLLLFLLNLLTRNRLISLIFTLSYMFDNALVVHGRGALLEGMQIFFFLLTITSAVMLHRAVQGTGRRTVFWAGLVGSGFAATALIKVTGLVLLPVVMFAVYRLLKEGSREHLRAGMCLMCSFLVTFFLVWQIHFMLGRRVVPALPNQGYYGASSAAQALINGGLSAHLFNFPLMLREYVAFSQDFNSKVERLNLCKPEESGSTPYLWPIGARSIHYQWEHHDGKTSYWMLQINPVVWWLGIIGLILAGSCVVGVLFFGLELEREKLRSMSMLLFLWLLYMGTMVSLSRVMYLYHYFIPLIISLILGAIALSEVRVSFSANRQRIAQGLFGGGYVLLLISAFWFFSPLTYGIPLTEQEFRARGLLDVWDLRVYNGELSNYIARPICDPRQSHK